MHLDSLVKKGSVTLFSLRPVGQDSIIKESVIPSPESETNLSASEEALKEDSSENSSKVSDTTVVTTEQS